MIFFQQSNLLLQLLEDFRLFALSTPQPTSMIMLTIQLKLNRWLLPAKIAFLQNSWLSFFNHIHSLELKLYWQISPMRFGCRSLAISPHLSLCPRTIRRHHRWWFGHKHLTKQWCANQNWDLPIAWAATAALKQTDLIESVVLTLGAGDVYQIHQLLSEGHNV